MILPKKGQVWTYKERGKWWAVTGSVPILVFLVIGIYYGIWQIILFAVLGLLASAWLWIATVRKYRDEP